MTRHALWMIVTLAGIVGAQDLPDALELYRQGQFDAAVAVTLQELDENPANLDAFTVLGWSLLSLGRFDEALEYGQRGLRVSRFDHRLVHIVGEAHFRLNNNLEALDHLETYAALAPTGTQIDEVYYAMGEVLIRLEEYHRADIALSAAVGFDDTRALWWARLGFAREMAGSEVFAQAAYEQALARNPALIEAQRGAERVGG